MNIVFLGGIFGSGDGREKEIYEKSKIFVYAAADAHQKHIIAGLKNRPGVNLTLINSVFVGTYPREYRDLIIRSGRRSEDGTDCIETGFLNLFGVRNLWRRAAVYKALSQWCEEHRGQDMHAVVYSMLTPFMSAAAKAKKKYPELKLCLYVPDLPGYFTENKAKGALYRFLKKYDCAAMNGYLPSFDSFALLTRRMNGRVNLLNKPFEVIEGIVSSESSVRSPDNFIRTGGTKNVVYTGKTDAEFGIMELVEAFGYVTGDITLDIYGSGNADRELRLAAAADKRICFHGPLRRSDVLEKQREACILINPRSPQKEFTEYSFPSKTIEYLAAGRPVIMHRLAGIPEEYDKHLIYFDSTEPRAMAETIMRTAALGEAVLSEAGAANRAFILENKNEKVQGDRLIGLLERGDAT